MAIETERGKQAFAQLEQLCARYPEVSTRLSHNTPAFFIRDKKVLCYLWEDQDGDGNITICCPAPAGIQTEMAAREPDRFFVPRYVGHRGWLGVRLDTDCDWEEINHILIDAYRTAAPKTLVKQLDLRLADNTSNDATVDGPTS